MSYIDKAYTSSKSISSEIKDNFRSFKNKLIFRHDKDLWIEYLYATINVYIHTSIN